MDRCTACGAALAPGAQWCGQCFTVVAATAATAAVGAVAPGGPAPSRFTPGGTAPAGTAPAGTAPAGTAPAGTAPGFMSGAPAPVAFVSGGPAPAGFTPVGAQPREVPTRTTRWQKTPTTFGPLGRVVASCAVLVPLLVMIVGGFVDMFAWGGAAVYGAVIVPWAMRDIWRAGRIPLTS